MVHTIFDFVLHLTLRNAIFHLALLAPKTNVWQGYCLVHQKVRHDKRHLLMLYGVRVFLHFRY